MAEIIGQKLCNGEWVGHVPSERRLCHELQISRKTVRAALDTLRRQGWVKTSPTGRRLIAVRRGRLKALAAQKVVLLGSKPMYREAQMSTLIIEELEFHLHKAGLKMEIVISPQFLFRDCSKMLAQVVQQTPASCWILWGQTVETHRWFADRGLHALVLGSTTADASLPSVDIDYEAAMQHAVQTLLAKGHRRIALFCERSALAGNQMTTHGFLAAFRSAKPAGAEAKVICHDGTPQGVGRMLEALFAGKSPPTALVVSCSFDVLSVMGHLTRLGLRIPADVSLISRDDDSCLAHVVPRLARYTCDPILWARQFARLAIRLASGESVSARQVRLMPQFVAGESIAPPPARRA
ncbi:MAG: substrate-binding domain-containing protein [Acidobacteria bacterium]|nr:substrate-binding domain-containing protein [Acidobacteriota bacterium]